MIFKILCKITRFGCRFPTSSAVSGLISIHKANCDNTGLEQASGTQPFLGRQWYTATREKIAAFPLSQFQIAQLYDKYLVSTFSVNKVYVYFCRN